MRIRYTLLGVLSKIQHNFSLYNRNGSILTERERERGSSRSSFKKYWVGNVYLTAKMRVVATLSIRNTSLCKKESQLLPCICASGVACTVQNFLKC